LVVRLKISPPEAEASVITSSTRVNCPGGNVGAVLRMRCAGASVSGGVCHQKRAPTTKQAMPGTAKAARQPACWTRKPVTMAAAAMPRLPARPLTPIAAPGFSARCTSIGMPTG
jgi:hypothetical protein